MTENPSIAGPTDDPTTPPTPSTDTPSDDAAVSQPLADEAPVPADPPAHAGLIDPNGDPNDGDNQLAPGAIP